MHKSTYILPSALRSCRAIVYVAALGIAGVAQATTKTATSSDHNSNDDLLWWTKDANWNPAGKPTSSDDCIIPSKSNNNEGVVYWAEESGGGFTGNSLQLGSVGKVRIIFVDKNGQGKSLTFPGSGLIFGRVSFRCWDTTPNVPINGDLTVLSTEAAPSEFSASSSNPTTYSLQKKLIGDGDAYLSLVSENDNGSIVFPLTFDGSEYLGTLRYDPGHPKAFASTFGSTTFNGLIDASNTVFTLPEAVTPTVAKMRVRDSSVKISLNTKNEIGGDKSSGELTVRDALTMAPGAKIQFGQTTYPTTWKEGDAGETLWPFLTVPLASDIDVCDFDLATTQTMVSGVFYPEYDLVVRTNATSGTKMFVSRRRAYIQSVASKPSMSADNVHFAWGSCDPDTDYFAKGSEGRDFYTPDQALAVFGGKSFCLWSDLDSTKTVMQTHKMILQTGDVTFDDLRVQAGDRFQAYKAVGGTVDGVVLRGNMLLFKDSRFPREDARVVFCIGGNSVSIEVASNLSGTEDVVTEGFSGTGRTLLLSGDNLAWTGGILATNQSAATSRIAVSRTEALGGPLAEFRADALTIGKYGIFGVTDDVTMDEPTRGVTIDDSETAKIDVADGKTLVLNEKVTFAGTSKLTKTGNGTLSLGGTVEIATGGSAALDVQAGTVKPTAADALAGVTLSCGENGAFLYDVPAGETGFGATGLVDPVVANGSLFRMAAAITETPAQILSIPVCTLAADNVSAFRAAFKFVRTTPHTSCRLIEKSAGDGRVTLVAEIGRYGVILVVR